MPIRTAKRSEVLTELKALGVHAIVVELVQFRAAVLGLIDDVKLAVVDAQLRASHDRIETEIDEWRNCYRSGNRDSVFRIRHQTQITAGKCDLLDRYCDRVVALQGISRVLRHERSVGVPQRNCCGGRQERYRRHGPHVEAAYVVFAAHVEALERRRNQTTEAAQE